MKTHKEKLKVIICTANFKIKGEVHLYENSRLTDILNADTTTKDFLPITDAVIIDRQKGTQQEVAFLSINRHFIELVLEDDEAIAVMKAKEALSKRKYPEALQFAQRAARAVPDDAEAQYLLGFCLAKNGDFKGAKTAIEQCLKLKPNVEIAKTAQEFLNTLTS
ncbi:MAG: tetratricopeptide repeat protein [Candidatus Riflebacteria bacterium]|nr:tetratricopeptide repeat protein [Candidatus Riflebacteria bacterium]